MNYNNTQFRLKLYQTYIKIMDEEAKLNPACVYYIEHQPEICCAAKYIMEVAKSSHISRSYNDRYGLSHEHFAYESVGAHTNLVQAIASRALACYSDRYGKPLADAGGYYGEGYTYQEIMETIRIHDLPENDIGDWPDNGSTNQTLKAKKERAYLTTFGYCYTKEENSFTFAVAELFDSMDEKDTYTGRLIYSADKIAAIIATLTADSLGHRAMISKCDPYLSKRDKESIRRCDFSENGFYKASEMWTIDHLELRKLCQYDDEGFFTALLVMYTLLVNGKWYLWRENTYKTHSK